jgi:hypothetical protein
MRGTEKGVGGCVQVCAGVCRCVCRCVQVCAGVCRCVQVCAGVCRCVQVCAGVCRCAARTGMFTAPFPTLPTQPCKPCIPQAGSLWFASGSGVEGRLWLELASAVGGDFPAALSASREVRSWVTLGFANM